MSPFLEPSENTERKTFEKTRFLNLTLGEHTVRCLSKYQTHIHYIPFHKSSITCLGEECPICANNKKIIMEHPKDFKEITGWLPRQPRHYFNVVDRTLVKVCPNCQEENKRGINGQFPAACVGCNTFLPADTPIHPSDKVKVLSISETNKERLRMAELSNLDQEGNVISLDKSDLIVRAAIINGKKDISLLTTKNTDVVTVPEEFWYDLKNVTITLTPEEVIDHLKGVTLKDIFTARRAEVSVAKEEKLAEEVNVNIQEKIKALIGE